MFSILLGLSCFLSNSKLDEEPVEHINTKSEVIAFKKEDLPKVVGYFESTSAKGKLRPSLLKSLLSYIMASLKEPISQEHNAIRLVNVIRRG